MNSKIILFVFMVMFYVPNHSNAQKSSSKKIEKTADKVKKGKSLADKIFKTKTSKKQLEESIENTQNNELDSSKVNSTTDKSLDTNTQILIESQETPLTKAAIKLFKNCNSKTTNAEKNEIAALMNFHSTPDDSQFLLSDDDFYSQFPFDAYVYPVDINNDTIEELAIVYGHPAITGDNNSSTLFIKDKKGNYIKNFGFPSFLMILPNSTKNFPDIVVGGPGFEFPVWRWNGTQYNYLKKITDKQLEASKPIDFIEASKRYTDKIKN